MNHSRYGAGLSASKYFKVQVHIAAGTGDDGIDVYSRNKMIMVMKQELMTEARRCSVTDSLGVAV